MASVVAADLVLLHSATQSDTDGVPVGGAIDTLRRPDFTQVTAGDTVEALSSNAGDTTQTLTITARKADGTVVAETKTLTGTTAVIFSGNGAIDRILKAELSATTTGSITVRKSAAGATYRVIPAGERGFSAVIRQGSSSTGGGINYFAKTFWKNTNGTNDEPSDGSGGRDDRRDREDDPRHRPCLRRRDRAVAADDTGDEQRADPVDVHVADRGEHDVDVVARLRRQELEQRERPHRGLRGRRPRCG
jgi:hypothetical protein